MKYANVLSLQPVQIGLLISALVGAFMLGKCLVEQHPIEKTKPDQSAPDNLPTTVLIEQKQQEQQEAIYYNEYNEYDEQSRDIKEIRLNEQCCLLPFPYFLRDDQVSRIISVAPEQKPLQQPFQPIIVLKPLRKKKRIAPPRSFVQIFFPQQKKRVAPSRSSAQIFFPQPKKRVALSRSSAQEFFPQQKKRVALSRSSAQEFFPQPKKHVAPPRSSARSFFPQQKKRVAPPRSSAQSFFPQQKKHVAPPERSGRKFLPQSVGKDYGQFACKGSLIPAVLATVTELEARSILYGTGPLSDCSGIFHRVLKGLKKRCPEHAYPSLSQYRDSRHIARWYHEQGELVLIKDPLKQTSVIRPGMVLFFGHTGVWYTNPSVNTLLSPLRGIYHVGVVARVHRDRTGKIVQYELFHGHGHRGKTTASVTKWHKRKPDRADYPPFGNGRQQLVAAARIIRPVETGKSGNQ